MIDLVRELVEPSRRALLAELKAGPRTVGELVEITGLKQPNVSNHLSRLRTKGILKASKVGRQVYYSFADPDIARAAISLVTPVDAPERILDFGPETTRNFSRSACLGDEQACTDIVDSLLRGSSDIVRIYSRLFAESMKMIGQWWVVKAIDEGQEHLASAIIERLMARVLHYASPPRPGNHKAVLGCSEGNWHTIGLRMISDVMRLHGWRTLYLGANVPTASFLASVKEHDPEAVMVSCPIADYVPASLELVGKLDEMRGHSRFLIGVGGSAVIDARQEFRAKGADFWCADLVEFAEVLLPLLDSRDHSQLSSLMKV
jgi:MerR family transcriptional regulator, light-induced transcriptional regulator